MRCTMDLPKQQKEEMFIRILKHVADSVNEEGTDAKISTKMVHKLTGIDMTEEYVLANKGTLNDEFGHLSAAYGFTDFHDFYLYAMSCDEQEVVHKSASSGSGKSKNKDFSKLKQVRRTVIRNGKPTEMTFYEDPNKGKKSPAQSASEQGDAEEVLEALDAKELIFAVVGSKDERATIKDVKEVKSLHEQIEGYVKFDADIEKYMVFAHPEYKVPMAIIGFTYEGENTVLAFSDSSPLVENWDVRVYMETTKEALREGMGMSIPHLGTQVFDIFVETDGLEIPETQNGQYTIDYDTLVGLYGYDS